MRNIPLPENSLLRGIALIRSKPSSSFYVRGDYIYSMPSSRNSEGWWFSHEPLLRTSLNASFDEMGQVLLASLTSSGSGVFKTERVSNRFDIDASEFSELSKIKTWSEFTRGTRQCSVSVRGISFVFLPTRNMGRSRFDHLPDEASKLWAMATTPELGAALKSCFARCRIS